VRVVNNKKIQEMPINSNLYLKIQKTSPTKLPYLKQKIPQQPSQYDKAKREEMCRKIDFYLEKQGLEKH